MADILTHHCPNCGGPLTFNPSDQKFHCDYCLSIFTVEDIEQFEAQEAPPTAESTDTGVEEKNTADDMDLFLCPSCGAQIVTDHTTAATYCYFCHNPVVLSGRLTGAFLPNKVLPFKIEKEKAISDFLAWTKKKRFTPKDFFNEQQIEKMTGVYFPYWVIDAETAGNLTGKGTSLRVWIIGDIEYTETKVYQIFRRGKAKIQHLTKNALTKNLQQKMVEGVQPFPIDQAVDFHTEYLSGFQAEKRDIEITELSEQINHELTEYTEDLLRDTVAGYTTFTPNNRSVTVEKQDNHYMLLPVWLVTYQDATDKTYYYAMNGQTGKVSGILPVSNKRLGLFSGGIFAVLLVIALIAGYLI
ncbi:TFIIB-type zinc ribbon-containing protein [Enterococcus xiangfangensis]|uniref:TFIIB-type zinc ribbon-containing protein n=1 Tax=Enterococcus xiangfangensis TaxID=1296537 RepID=A0ABU3FA59_9ENTE|nr:TFIIB-type zinc ribbon-containing protein [Enterococcus xiangfangensis]MDT2758555.1 TFIIB-type zinc ribbon-containing protein [Enterococcus xiangfangensis]